MAIVIDRRSESSKGRGSRERLIQRTREAAREAINKSIREGNITDIGRGGADVVVPKGGLAEPQIHHGPGGVDHRVLPGNNNEQARFRAGDRLPRPQGRGGGGPGAGASPEGEGEDSFVYHLSEKEFLDILFDDLELPNLFKLGADDDQRTTLEHAGFSHTGPFNRLSLVRSKAEKIKREMVMNRGTNKDLLALLEEEKDLLAKYAGEGAGERRAPETGTEAQEKTAGKAKVRVLEAAVRELKTQFSAMASPSDAARISAIDAEVALLNEKKRLVGQWRERTDLRFRAVEEEKLPTSKAVMFCELDVSGSMTEEMKSNAKIFFFLLNRFLKRQYDRVDVVFIRHHTVAEEVDEKEFFEGQVTGGTVVSTAHEKLLEIQTARYPEKEWNIYGAQASDGDNEFSDQQKTGDLMKKILPVMQGFFHIEVGNAYKDTDLWRTYRPLAADFSDRFWMAKVREKKDVWPVFREFFKKRQGDGNTAQPRSAAFGPG